jgi:tetratricopeptide (TPR) repeat protein
LHRLHTDWNSAQGDIDKAIELAPDLPQIDLTLARLLLDTKRYEGAEKALDRFIQRVPNHVDALVTRGRARVGSGSPLQAAEDFGRAIAHAAQPEPEHYIEQARAFAAAGQDHIPAAIAALDAGMMRLGKLVTLGLYAVELECTRRNFDAALERLDALSASQPRKESWHERRGDVLDAAGRSVEAKAAYIAGIEAIKTLPPHIQNTAAVQQRQERLEGKIKESASSTSQVH